MKVLLINGSPNANGNTAMALREMEKVFSEQGIETEWIHVGNMAIRGCLACQTCYKNAKCAIDDIVNEVAKKLYQGLGFEDLYSYWYRVK